MRRLLIAFAVAATVPGVAAALFDGNVVVVDAPLRPTSKYQCKNGGWHSFPGFKNQGDCVSFAATGGGPP